jgi:hypothetical protein
MASRSSSRVTSGVVLMELVAPLVERAFENAMAEALSGKFTIIIRSATEKAAHAPSMEPPSRSAAARIGAT